MDILITPSVRWKLTSKHSVAINEVLESFNNRTGKLLEDHRPEHKTSPPTYWFIAETDQGRSLKIVFVLDKHIHIKTAYTPNDEEIRIYNKHGF